MLTATNQNTPSVVRLPSAKTTKKATRYETRKVSRREQSATRQQAIAAVVLGTVAVALVALSLSHLSCGIRFITGCEWWEAVALATGIDLGFAGLEYSRLAARERTLKTVNRYVNGAIFGTVIGSMLMNGVAFAAQAPAGWTYAATALGLAIPLLVLVLTKVGGHLWLDR
jgi:hypothetical protein